jgi:phospholipid-binding lipoprotein MlaA
MQYQTYKYITSLHLLIVTGLCTGCATTSNTGASDADIDPLESINRPVYSFNDGLDRLIIKPVAMGYADVTPQPLRTGVTNFFNNLAYLNVIMNSSLQGKLDQSLSDIFRFVFNSTLGVAGVFDVATVMGLEAHREDLGQTLAVWGSGQGAYLTLPFFGPNTVRDTPDLVSSWFLNPINYTVSTIAWPAIALNIINNRANLMQTTNLLDSAATDPYSFTREAYLQQRESLIRDGMPPEGDDFEQMFEEESGGGTF